MLDNLQDIFGGMGIDQASTLSAMVIIIVQVLKAILPKKFPTQFLAIIVSFIVCYGFLFLSGQTAINDCVLGVFESFTVAFLSMFGHDTLKDVISRIPTGGDDK